MGLFVLVWKITRALHTNLHRLLKKKSQLDTEKDVSKDEQSKKFVSIR